MPEVIDLGFRPRPWQLEVILHIARFMALVVHRRGGKTLLAIMKLIDALEDNDDVQKVYSNAEFSDAFLAKLGG